MAASELFIGVALGLILHSTHEAAPEARAEEFIIELDVEGVLLAVQKIRAELDETAYSDSGPDAVPAITEVVVQADCASLDNPRRRCNCARVKYHRAGSVPSGPDLSRSDLQSSDRIGQRDADQRGSAGAGAGLVRCSRHRPLCRGHRRR